MEKEKLYPEGTVQQTDDFALRQKIKKIVGESVEAIIKEETIGAFEELGYEEKDGYMFVISAGGEENKEKEIGKGAKEGKLNVTVSIPKMLNMGATKPVSYMQKVVTFGGKKLVSEIYIEIVDKNVHVDYKNTEASAFSQSSKKDTYVPNELNKSAIISGIEEEKKFKESFKKFFKPIAKAEAEYLIGTKIANDDKTQKNMNDSIVKENKYNMKLTDIFSNSFEEAGDKIENLIKESKLKNTEAIPAGSEKDKDKENLLIGSNEEEQKLEEITAAPAPLAGATSADAEGKGAPKDSVGPGFAKKLGWGEHEDTASKKLGYTLAESVKNTTYGQMRTTRPHLTRQDNGSYALITESDKVPYTEKVKMEPGTINTPIGMDKNYVMGQHEKNVEEAKENKENVEEQYAKKLDLIKRKFVTESENKEQGVNKRYIITEKLTGEEQKKRWKQLYECDCFCNVKDKADTVSANEYESKANKEFEANNKPLESNLSNTVFSGQEPGFKDIQKAKGSMIVFRLSESDIKQNKMYLLDHFTNKLVLNPLYKSKD